MSNLKRITFTGVDEFTRLGDCRIICGEDERIEFAVLWSFSKGGVARRYPAKPFELCNRLPPGQRAIHACGEAAERLCWLESSLLSGLDKRGTRLQVNKPDYDERELLNLATLAKATGMEVIIQCGGSGSEVVWRPGLSVLFDGSRGKGMLPSAWPKPMSVYDRADVIAYAGGLGPHNMDEQLPLIDEARGGGSFGVDMETYVRTDDWLDIGKVEAVRSAVLAWEVK